MLNREKQNANAVGATSSRPHFEGMTQNKGITLIALIITVIVMLILVGVTINVTLNGGLFTKAQQASEEMQVEAEKEELLSAVVAAIGTDGKVRMPYLNDNLPEGWSGTGGTYTSPKGNTYTVNEYGKIEGGTSTGGITNQAIPEELKKYILGADGEGRALIELDEDGNPIGGIFNGDEFLDDPLTEDVDETETLGVEALTYYVTSPKVFMFIVKHDKKAYKVVADSTWNTEKMELIYEPKGNEGKTTAEGWTILYDNGSMVEAVSPTAMGELSLGYSKTATTNEQRLEEAIESYNSAIGIINNYCKGLEGLPENSGVRSVGGEKETTSMYTSTSLETYNGKGKAGDMLFEQDLVRMSYWGVIDVETSYWMASRYVYEYSKGGNDITIYFNVPAIEDGVRCDDNIIWYVNQNRPTADSRSYAVRPIITVKNL